MLTQTIQHSITQIETNSTWLRVHFSNQSWPRYADYHYVWLRHNCDRERHPQTGERTLCLSKVPATIRPSVVRIGPVSQSLEIVWDDGEDRHASSYDVVWLKRHAYAPERTAWAEPTTNLSNVELQAADFTDPDDLRHASLALVKRFGLALVRGYGLDTETLIELYGKSKLNVRGTHFGRIEDLRTDNTTNQNTDQLGYTNAAVELHTDQPFLPRPPEFQLLQSMREATQGGDNYLSDAKHAAFYLRSSDLQAYDLLTKIDVTFHRKQKAFEKSYVSPIHSVHAGERFMVRYSYFTMAPQRLSFELMGPWYEAYRQFAGLLNSPANQYRFTLRAGDYVFYNNHRMVHAREAFSGPRWVRGIYFDTAQEAGSPELAQK